MREISIIADGRAIPCEQDCDTDLALHSYLATLRQLRDQEPRAVEEAVEAPSLEAADIKPDRPDVIEFLARTYPHLSADYIRRFYLKPTLPGVSQNSDTHIQKSG